jgi:hypothetical protein
MRDVFAGKRHTSYLSSKYGTTSANVIAWRRCEYIVTSLRKDLSHFKRLRC